MSGAERQRAIDSVDYDLRSLDAEVRRLAVERITELSAPDALPRLVGALSDPVRRVRSAAVARILALGHGDQVDPLLIDALIGDGPKPRRHAALEALVRRGADAVPRIAEALRSAAPGARRHLIEALAGIGDESAEASVRALLDDADPQIAALAAAALGVFGGAASAADLVAAAMCEHADDRLRAAALRSLARLEVGVDPAALEPLLEDPALCPAALTAIATSDDPVATELLFKRLTSPAPAELAASITGLIEVIGRCDLEDVDRVQERICELSMAEPALSGRVARLLEEGPGPARAAALQFVGLIGDAGLAVSVLEVCRDELLAPLARGTLGSLGGPVEGVLDQAWERLDAALRREVCVVLATTGGRTGLERLRGALQDPELAVRLAAIEALAERAAPGGISPLVSRLRSVARDSEADARDEWVAIVDALIDIASGRNAAAPGRACAEEVVEALRASFDDAPDAVRVAAARVLGRIAQPADAPFVFHLLRDPSAEVRRAAILASPRLDQAVGAQRLRLALLDEDVGVRCAATAALAATEDDGVFEDLVRLYQEDECPRVRGAILRALGACAKQAASDDAAAFVAEAALDEPLVAIAAAEALSEIGGARAVEVALGLLDRPEPEVVQSAVACVARHGGGDALERLLELVAHPAWPVRCEVIRAFALRRFVRAAPLVLRCLETERDAFVRAAILETLAHLDG